MVADGENKINDADLATDDGEGKVVDRARLDPGADRHDVIDFADDVQLVEVGPGFMDPRLRPTGPVVRATIISSAEAKKLGLASEE